MPTHSSFTAFTPGEEDDPERRISSIDPKLSRSHYFDGKLLRASDLIRDQLYLDERLREAGRAMGEGIVRGFEVSLSLEGDLSVTPGLAIAPSGRALEHEGPDPLVVNLFDTARIAALNPAEDMRIERGLYAVVARLATRRDGSAEVFPGDLAGERRFHAAAHVEGVELVLTRLDARLPSASRRLAGGGAYESRGASDRAALARDLLGNEGQPPELDADAVALALLAVERGGPVWLDRGLVRRGFRAHGAEGAAQAVLTAHHAELLAAVLAERAAAGRTGAFAAIDYFDRLPPAGRMPPDCVDPAAGVQRFFPSGFDVSIAPVRTDDLPAILDEAALLDPIDLSGAAAADVMILAPLPDGAFDRLARRIELDPTERAARESAYRSAVEAIEGGAAPTGDLRDRLRDYERLAVARAPLAPNRLPSIGALPLRARGAPPALDADVSAWRAIHAETRRSGDLWFVRRAPRAAATGVSAVVAARGHALPPLGDAPPGEIDALRTELEEAERARDEAQAQARELAAAVESLRARLAEEESGDDAALSEARERAARLEARLGEVEARAARLDAVTAEARGFERERDEARAEVERLRERLEERPVSDELRAETERMGRDSAEARTRADDFARRAAESEERMAGLQAALAEANRRIAELRGRREPVPVEPRETLRVAELAERRDVADRRAVRALAEIVGDDRGRLEAVNLAVAAADPRYDAVLWESLIAAGERGRLPELAEVMRAAAESGQPLGLAVAARASRLGIPAALRDRWSALDL